MNGLKIKTTHIAQVRAQYANQMDEVCALIEKSRDEYCIHQFRQYEKFCEKLAGGHIKFRDRLRYSPVFRGFFNNEWAHRNANDFLPFAKECDQGVQWIIEEYTFIHNASRLINCDDFYSRFEQILKSI